MNIWLDTLANHRLPVLQATCSKMDTFRNMAAANTQFNLADLANVALGDPLMAFQVLRSIGRIERTRTFSESLNIDHALMILGADSFFAEFKRLSPLENSPSLSQTGIDQIIGMMSRARVAALLIKDWLSLMEEHRVEDCFVAALLHNVAACAYRVESGVDKPFLSLDALGRHAGFLDYKQMVERFIESQKLPDLLLDLLTEPPSFDRRRLLLKSAIEVANLLEQGWWRNEMVEKITGVSHLLAQPFETLWQDMVQLVLSVARNPDVPGYQLLARQLAYMPEPEQPAGQDFLSLNWDKAAASNQTSALDDALRWVVGYLARDLGQERVIFFRNDAAHKQLNATQFVGLNDSDDLIARPIALVQHPFFGNLVQKAQAFRCQPGQLDKLKGVFADPFFDRIGDHGFATMSVIRGDKLIGVFYLDNASAEKGIEEAIYQQFKMAVSRLCS